MSKEYPPDMPGWEPHVYRRVDDSELSVFVRQPGSDAPTPAPRPAIVFFFGGGWSKGTPAHFKGQGKHLASRGMVAITVDYRVRSRQSVEPEQCVSDAFAAMRMVRGHARAWGIDPDRIAAGGGSAGGHLAACTALLPEPEPMKGDVVKVASPRPDALALFNPVLVVGEVEPDEYLSAEAAGSGRFGQAKPSAISPYHHLDGPLPPTIIFHGEADTTTPHADAAAFARKATARGSRCELVSYPDQGHGFFNAHRDATPRGAFVDTVTRTETFFHKLGWLPVPADRSVVEAMVKE